MKPGPFAFIRTTTFRLALLYSGLFAIFTAGFLAYLYQATVGAARAEEKTRLESEYEALAVAYQAGGAERLQQAIFERALVRVRDFTYQYEDASGRVIVGDFQRMPVNPLAEAGMPRSAFFEVERPLSDGSPLVTNIESRVVRLANGDVLLVGINTDDRLRQLSRVSGAIITAVPVGIVLALLGGFFSASYAARRAEALTRTAREVMAGDLSKRAPVVGSGDEFDRLAEQLNAMLGKIETLMETTRHSGNAIAHDLRSPLSRLRNRLEVALRGPVSEELARDTLANTVEEVDQVLATFNAILRLARLREGAEGKMQDLSLSDLAAEMADLFEPACEDAGLSFAANIGSDLSLTGDHALLAQAVSNLLDNAIKYTPTGGSVTLSCRPIEGGATIEVSDNGPGIPSDDLERVKQRFVRLDEARTKSGSGLGLALVEAVAEMHGGSLQLVSPPGGGLKASLLLGGLRDNAD
ncbi:MAG: ATP-binding protein [Pseudomonadota bacterium]